MTYKLFIDDERFPVDPHWFVARTSEEAKIAVSTYGMPSFISFDHDLGDVDTSMRFLHFLRDRLIDSDPGFEFPADFEYTIHSQNPIGAANIDGLMRNLIRHFKKD